MHRASFSQTTCRCCRIRTTQHKHRDITRHTYNTNGYTFRKTLAQTQMRRHTQARPSHKHTQATHKHKHTCLHSCSITHEHVSQRGGHALVNRLRRIEACRIIGLSSTEDRRAAAAYYRFGVVPSLCDVMQRWPSHERLQRTAVYALRHVLEDPDAAVEALCIGGPRLVSRAAETHPGFEDLEHNSSKAVQLMSKHRRRWVQESEAPRSGLPSPESDSGAPIQPLMQHVRLGMLCFSYPFSAVIHLKFACITK